MTAYIQAIQLWDDEPDQAKDVLAEFLILDDQEELDLTHDWFANAFQREPVPRAEEMNMSS